MKIEPITSSNNSKFKTWQSLNRSVGIRDTELCLVSGEKLVNEQIFARSNLISALVDFDEQRLHDTLLKTTKVRSENSNHLGFLLSKDLFNDLDEFGTKTTLAVVKTNPVPTRSWREVFENIKGLIVIAPLSDPTNLGALIRSCSAFDVSQIVLTKESANPFLPKTIRASSGMSFHSQFLKTEGLESLSTEVLSPHQIITLDKNGESLKTFKWPNECILLVGEEGPGLSRLQEPTRRKLRRVSVPINESTESLNATVALSIALFSYYTKN